MPDQALRRRASPYFRRLPCLKKCWSHGGLNVYKSDEYKVRSLYIPTRPGEAGASRYKSVMLANGQTRRATQAELDNPSELPEGAHLFRDQGLTSRTGSATTMFPFTFRDRTYSPTSGGWRTSETGLRRLAWANRLLQTGNTLSYRKNWDDFSALAVTNFWEDVSGGITSRSDPKIYVVQTSTKIVERCMLMTTDPGDLVLDPTCGSGTTAYVAEQWGRRWITIDTSRVALALARSRIMSARYPYYLLADSAEGAAKEQELTGQPQNRTGQSSDVRHGFVYKRVPHILLSSIARNERIIEGMSGEEIDRVIFQGADQEVLVDQPYEDARKIRVSGRFTVESLSPHRNLDEPSGTSVGDGKSFVSTIVENLQTSGVQNTFRGERLSFDTLEPYASDGLLHAHGTITDADGEVRTVAIMIGPEHGTVSPDMVKDAAREALKGAGFDILVVCGFAFEAYASETAKEFAPSGDGFVAAEDERKMGRLRVLLTHMNPDLAMSNELLKKTGSGNLFTVFGEPDVTITATGGEIVIEVHGVDVYDPTTGVVRPSSTDDIACWFIDTDYDGEQFFVRHAYFTGADRPYEKLQRSLNADIDEGAWASLYSTTSRPFSQPSTGRIAVKVINHYGDEVLQVYDVGPASQQSAQ